MNAKSEADLNYAFSLKDDVLKMCMTAEDSNKIKLSEVKDQFKTIPLHILGIVMDVLCGDNALIANIMGRMTLYAVPPDILKEKQTSIVKDSCDKGKHPKEKDKENVIPKGIQTAKKTVPAAGNKRKKLSVHDDGASISHPHAEHSSAGSAAAKNTTATKKKTKTGADSRTAEPSTQQHEPKKSNQVIVSNANRSLMTYSPGPLNQDAQREVVVSQDSVAEEDVEFVSLALYGIFDGMVDVTSLSALTESLTQKDPTFTKPQVDSCLHHLEMKNKIMIFGDEIYLI